MLSVGDNWPSKVVEKNFEEIILDKMKDPMKKEQTKRKKIDRESKVITGPRTAVNRLRSSSSHQHNNRYQKWPASEKISVTSYMAEQDNV